MSAVIKAVAGIALIAVGALTSLWGGEYLIAIGTSLLLNAAAQALGPKPPRAPPLSGIDIAYSGTLEPRRIIYGALKISGMNVIPPMTSGSNNDYFHQVLALAGHPVNSIGDVYFGQIRIPSGNIGAIAGNANDGLVSGIPDPPSGQVNGKPYNGLAWVRRYDGTQTSVDTILSINFAVWDVNHKGQGIAYLALQFKFDQGTYSSGVPQVTCMVQGKKVYDPRLDSTNGGSGSQRYTDPSTWTYSTNPALCLRDYLTSSLGLGEAQTRIDDTLVSAAANKCDESVTVPIPVLVGLTSWTHLSAVVTGQNTAFQAPGALVAGGYVKAPNGSMLQVSTVDSDVQFTLTSTYSGSSATGQVTQYNNGSSSTATTQKRYTCNTVLDATARFEDNIATLASAMQGYCVYSAGKWRMYAGGWSGSAFSLTEDDLVGTVSLQCTTPRKDLFNAVRGNFIDPQQNYQPSEFPPITNSTYESQDGGERIYVETNYPCCSDRFEAQRNAIVLNRQGRNKHTVTAQYGMSAYGIKVYETGTVTIAEVGWINQTVRCTGWKFTPQGIVELTLQEAYSADFTDPLTTDYAITGINVGPTAGYYLPYPPTALTATSVPGGIQFTVTLPSQVTPGTMIELWEYTASSPFAFASRVSIGTASQFYLQKNDTITRFYWARTLGPNGQFSATYPAVTGVAAAALTPSNTVWTPFVARGNCAYSDGAITKTGGPTAWGADDCYSINAYSICHISCKSSQAGAFDWMLGLATNPTANLSYTSIDYGWHQSSSDSAWHIYESGTLVATFGAVATSDICAITYDGSAVRYYLNDLVNPVRTVSISGLTLNAKAAFGTTGAGINSVIWGPTTNIKLNDTAELGSNAATELYTGSAVGPTSDGTLVGTMLRVSVPAIPFAHTAIVTATGDFWKNNTNGQVVYVIQALPGGTSGPASNSVPPVGATASPGDHITVQSEFSGSANQARDYIFWHNGGTIGTTLTWANVYVQVEIIKR